MPPLPGRTDSGRAIDPMTRVLEADVLLGKIAFFMWGILGVKEWRKFEADDRAQVLAGFVAIVAISLAWPLLRPGSYKRWRVPAMSCLHLFLFIGLPFNLKTSVYDVIAPTVGTGLVGAVANAFNLFLACRVALLLFTSLGWRLPWHIHVPVQATKVLWLSAYAARPYCESKLISSQQITAAAAGVHKVLSILAMPLIPPELSLIPTDPHGQRVAILLLSWLLLGWLLPTLLLLPQVAGQCPQGGGLTPSTGAGRARGGSGRLGRARAALSAAAGRGTATLERWIGGLLPFEPVEAEALAFPAGLLCMLRWWVLMVGMWGTCCAVATFGPR